MPTLLSALSICSAFGSGDPDFGRLVLAAIPANVFVLELSSNRVIWGNHALCETLGYPETAIEALSDSLVHPDDCDAIGRARETLGQSASGMCAELECRLRHSDGTWRWFASRLAAFDRDAAGVPTAVLGIGADITESKDALESVARDAARDPLTGIANRRRFLAEAKARISSNAVPMSLCMCDIDGFKTINDSHGHAAGDDVLRTFARLMDDLVRQEDVVARLGGDEFCLLLPGKSERHGVIVADRIRREIERREFASNGDPFRVTASFGIAQYQPGMTAPEWLAKAGEALYCAKRAGRDRIIPAGDPASAA